MNLATIAPVDIDRQLADLHGHLAKIDDGQASAITNIRYAIGEKPRYLSRNRKSWPTTIDQAIETARAKAANGDMAPWDRDSLNRSLARFDAAETERAAILAAMKPLNEEFARRPWSRFFLVTSSDGHVHSSMNCSTCHLTTTFGWNPELSGKTEPDAVAELGPLLCTTCFPSAPVEWTVGREKPAGCAGSGKDYKAGTRYRVGGRIYGDCVECGERQLTTQYGTVRKHKPAN